MPVIVVFAAIFVPLTVAPTTKDAACAGVIWAGLSVIVPDPNASVAPPKVRF